MDNNFYLSIGKRIRSARNRAGLTQTELASKANMSPATLGTYERGSRHISIEDLIILASKLETSIDYLLGIAPKITDEEYDLILLYRSAGDISRNMAKLSLKLKG